MISLEDLVDAVASKFRINPGAHSSSEIHKIFNDLEGRDALQRYLDHLNLDLDSLLSSSDKFSRNGGGKWNLRDSGTGQTAVIEDLLAQPKNGKKRAPRGGGGRGGGRAGMIPRTAGRYAAGGGAFKHGAAPSRGGHTPRATGTYGSAFRTQPPPPPAQQRPASPRRGNPPQESFGNNERAPFSGPGNNQPNYNNPTYNRRSPSPHRPRNVDDRDFNASRGFFEKSAYDRSPSPRRSPPRNRHRSPDNYNRDGAGYYANYNGGQNRRYDNYNQDYNRDYGNPNGRREYYDERNGGYNYQRSPPHHNNRRDDYSPPRNNRNSYRSPPRNASPPRRSFNNSFHDEYQDNQFYDRPMTPPQPRRRSPERFDSRSSYRQEPVRPPSNIDTRSNHSGSGRFHDRPQRAQAPAHRSSSPEFSQHSDNDSITAIPPPGISATSAKQRSMARADAMAVRPDPSTDPNSVLAALFNANVNVANRVVGSSHASPPGPPAIELHATTCKQILDMQPSSKMPLVDLFDVFEARLNEEFPGSTYALKVLNLARLRDDFPKILGPLQIDDKRSLVIWGNGPNRPIEEEGELTQVIQKYVAGIQQPQFAVADVVQMLRGLTSAPAYEIERKLTYVLFEMNKNKFRYTNSSQEYVSFIRQANSDEYILYTFAHNQHEAFSNPRKSERIEVEMVSYTKLNRFFVRFCTDSERFLRMSREMQTVYNDERRFPRRLEISEYKPDDAVAFKKPDAKMSTWCRGRVLDLPSMEAGVCLSGLDNGFIGFVDTCDILPLLPKFVEDPPYVLPCTFYKQKLEKNHWKTKFMNNMYEAIFIQIKGEPEGHRNQFLPVDLFISEHGRIVDIETAIIQVDGEDSD